jgi:hypothetical protein
MGEGALAFFSVMHTADANLNKAASGRSSEHPKRRSISSTKPSLDCASVQKSERGPTRPEWSHRNRGIWGCGRGTSLAGVIVESVEIPLLHFVTIGNLKSDLQSLIRQPCLAVQKPLGRRMPSSGRIRHALPGRCGCRIARHGTIALGRGRRRTTIGGAASG